MQQKRRRWNSEGLLDGESRTMKQETYIAFGNGEVPGDLDGRWVRGGDGCRVAVESDEDRASGTAPW